ncbi:MAG: DUF2459 domain-containing protein [Elainella sp.]
MTKPKPLLTALTSSVGLTLLLGLVALLGLLTPRRGTGNDGATCQYRVCVARFGYHSMLILPAVAPLLAGLSDVNLSPASVESAGQPASSASGSTISKAEAAQPDQDLRYLGVGWGAKRWYIDPPPEDAQLIPGLRALLLPNTAVIKVQRYADFPRDAETLCVGVTTEHFLQLVEFIRNTFERNAQNQPIYVAADPKHRAQFYAAKGTYWLFNNSNHWTATGLRIVGADTPLWPAHAAAIMRVVQPTCAAPSALLELPFHQFLSQPAGSAASGQVAKAAACTSFWDEVI